MMRMIFRILGIIGTANAVKRGTYGKRIGRRLIRGLIRKLFR